MNLAQLMNLHVSGALKIKYEEGASTAILGGTTEITIEQAAMLCNQFGWTEFFVSPFEIINKTNSMMASLKKSVLSKEWSDDMWERVQVEMQNKRATTYGKTFDRIVLYFTSTKRVTIIHGMEHIGAAYAVYVNGSAIPHAKCRTLGKVAESLLDL